MENGGEEMANVMKRDGRSEDFNNQKIKLSVLRAGANEKVASEVANTILESNAMTTANIRMAVTEELRKRNPESAKNYENTRRLTARKAIDAARGTVRISEEIMKRLDIKPGDPVELRHGNNTHRMKADKGASSARDINLNHEDLKTLGVTEGLRIAVRSPR